MRTHPIIEELEEIAPAADLRPLGSDGPMAERVSATMRRLGPGVVLVAGCVVAAFGVNGMVPAVSVLVAAVAIVRRSLTAPTAPERVKASFLL